MDRPKRDTRSKLFAHSKPTLTFETSDHVNAKGAFQRRDVERVAEARLRGRLAVAAGPVRRHVPRAGAARERREREAAQVHRLDRVVNGVGLGFL